MSVSKSANTRRLWECTLFLALTWWWTIVMVACNRLFVGEQEDRLGPWVAIEYLFFGAIGFLCIAVVVLSVAVSPPLSLGELLPVEAAPLLPVVLKPVPTWVATLFLGWLQYAGFGGWFLFSLRKWGRGMP